MKKGLFFLTILTLFCACKPETTVVDLSSIKGSWSCEERSTIGAGLRKYGVTIDPKLSDASQYLISNFHNSGFDQFVFMKMVGNVITIDDQSFGTLRVNLGVGVLSNDRRMITITYNIYEGASLNNYTVVYTR